MHPPSSYESDDAAVPSTPPPSGDVGGVDASTPAPPPAPDAGPPAATCTPFTGTPGSQVGDHFTPFTLQTCDGQARPFYNADLCASSYTVVMFSAGYCELCVDDSHSIRPLLDSYQSRGVDFIQVLVSDDNYDTVAAPSQSYCDTWSSTYNIEGKVLLDPDFATYSYAPDALPTIYIVDHQGVIQYRQDGESDSTFNLAGVRAKLDALFAGG